MQRARGQVLPLLWPVGGRRQLRLPLHQDSLALERAQKNAAAHNERMPTDTHALLDAPILTQDGSTTSLRAFLHAGSLLAVFVRHLG